MSVTVLESTQLDDRSPNITYAGADWTVHTNVQSIFHLYNNTDTFTDRQGATATLTFYGNAVEYWGNQGPYHGPCDISVDGNFCTTVNSHADVDDDPKLLWSSRWANGSSLELGMHTLEVKVKNPSYPNVCEIDRFVVNITTPGGGSTGGGSDGGSSATIGQTNNGGGGGGSTQPAKGPPVAAIAGAVGGAAVLALLLLAWWWFARRKKHQERIAKAIDGGDDRAATVPALLSNHTATPSPRTEKPGFGPGGGRPADRTSVLLSTPVSTPPPSSISYNQHYQAAGFDARATSPPASTVSGQYLNTPGSPQPIQRPMSVVSSTSGAPTMSYYSSGPVTSEAASFPMPGFVPPQHQQFAPQTPHQIPTQHEFQQQSYIGDAQNPVWAIPLGSQQQQRPNSPPGPSQPVPAMNPVDQGAHDTSSSAAYPPEKAQYRTTAAYPPEKVRYSGPAQSSTSGAGGSGSNVASGSGSGAGPSTSGAANNGQDIMNPALPEAPPPAYA